MRRSWRAALAQLELPFFGRRIVEEDRPAVGPAEDVDRILERLRLLGLASGYSCRLTTNRSVVVSHRGNELRVHRAFVAAPDEVLQAIVTFVQGRNRLLRNEARRSLLAYPIPATGARPVRSRERTHPADVRYVDQLLLQHHAYNAERFGGTLGEIPIRVSRRMRSRLGHYTLAGQDHEAEIVISRRHIRRHSWEEVLQTLLHEMVHQWQAETCQAVDHGRGFREKAREVGCAPAAKRAVG